MKCFAVKSGDEFTADIPRPIANRYYDGYHLSTVECDDEAKHYKTATQPKTWLRANIQRINNTVITTKKELANKSNRWYTNSLQRKIDTGKEVLAWLNAATVVELDLERPNYNTDMKLRWNRWRGDDHASKMKLCKVGHNRYSCKACGVQLKNIPYYDLVDGNSTKICVACLYLRGDAIKAAFEGMPEDFRTTFINELLLGSM